MYPYSAYQLTIASELLLPELCQAEDSIEKGQSTITISLGHARRESVTGAGAQGLYYQVDAQTCWFEIPNVTRFLIKQGRHITVEPFLGVDEASLRLFLYTVCFPLVLIYHNFVVFYGGALHWRGKGIAFLANFGEGKSTLLASFLKRDYFLLSDDICVLNQDGFILPGFPSLQLHEDALKNADNQKNVLERIRPQLQKWFVPVRKAFYSQPSLLKTVYIINPANRADFSLMPLVGLKKIYYLKKYTYNPVLVKGLGKDLLYFKQCAFLAARTSVIRVESAKQELRWDDLAHAIEQDLQRRMLEC